MSFTYLVNKNKQPKQHVSDFHYYLYNAHEPLIDDYRGSSADLKNEELENNYSVKRRFRAIAQSMRNQ